MAGTQAESKTATPIREPTWGIGLGSSAEGEDGGSDDDHGPHDHEQTHKGHSALVSRFAFEPGHQVGEDLDARHQGQ